MEDVVFQNQLYHDVVSDDGDIHLGDMVAWQHDETVCGEVVELLSTKEVDMVRLKTFNGQFREILLDECVPA